MPRRPVDDARPRPGVGRAVSNLALLLATACGVRPAPEMTPPGGLAAASASVPATAPVAGPSVAAPTVPAAPPFVPAPIPVPARAEVDEPTRYPPEQVHGPRTPALAARWRRLAATHPTRDDRTFLKTGASGTLNLHFFRCLAARPGPFPPVDWGDAPELAAAAAWFHPPAGERGRFDPFARRSMATEVSRTAGWALRGTPSPLEQEMAATNARFAIVAFGTNDMVMAGTPRAALSAYVGDLARLTDRLTSEGVLPLLTGPGPRAHVPAIARWVRVFDAATRAVAEARQVPYLSLEVLHRPLVAAGLARDGMHANTARLGAAAHPCAFDAEGLRFGYNARNLETLRVLDAVRRLIAPDPRPETDPASNAAPPLIGSGAPATPFVVDALPFGHAGWLAVGHDAAHYRLELGTRTALRIELVAPRGSGFRLAVDPEANPEAAPEANARPDVGRRPGARAFEGMLEPGRWTLRVARPTEPHAPGPPDPGARDYLLLVVPCDPGDPECR
jgi:hypothetical protein